MPDYLEALVNNARGLVKSGYYATVSEVANVRRLGSFKEALERCAHIAVIAEIKPSSPSAGIILRDANVIRIAELLERGGAAALSVLTEPNYFHGSIDTFLEVRRVSRLPMLMKDITVDPVQIEAAERIGADAVLLIQSVFDRYVDTETESLIDYAHNKGLEVLLEAHTEDEFVRAQETDADIIGMNNRNLSTLELDLETTPRLLKSYRHRHLIVAESGIESRKQIDYYRSLGVNCFLIGTSILQSPSIEQAVREFTRLK